MACGSRTVTTSSGSPSRSASRRAAMTGAPLLPLPSHARRTGPRRAGFWLAPLVPGATSAVGNGISCTVVDMAFARTLVTPVRYRPRMTSGVGQGAELPSARTGPPCARLSDFRRQPTTHCCYESGDPARAAVTRSRAASGREAARWTALGGHALVGGVLVSAVAPLGLGADEPEALSADEPHSGRDHGPVPTEAAARLGVRCGDACLRREPRRRRPERIRPDDPRDFREPRRVERRELVRRQAPELHFGLPRLRHRAQHQFAAGFLGEHAPPDGEYFIDERLRRAGLRGARTHQQLAPAEDRPNDGRLHEVHAA